MSAHRVNIWTAPTNSSGQQKLPTTHKGPRLAQLRGRHQKAFHHGAAPLNPHFCFGLSCSSATCDLLHHLVPCLAFPGLDMFSFICSHGNMQGRRVRRRRSNCPQLPTRWMKGLGWSLHLFGVYLILYISQVSKSLSENQTGLCSLISLLSVAASEL